MNGSCRKSSASQRLSSERCRVNMSDLAPFVAATLRDKVVADLMEENEQLKLNTALVKITGASGIPTYATGSIKDATVEVEGTEVCKSIALSSCVPHPNTLQDLQNTELWVGERRVGTLTTSLDNQAVQQVQHGDQHYLEFRCLYWEYQDTSIESFLEVGPFSAEEAQAQFGQCQNMPDDSPWPISGLDRVPGVTFKTVKFCEPNNQQPSE